MSFGTSIYIIATYQLGPVIASTFIFSIPLILIQFIFPEFIYFFDPTISHNSNSLVAFRILLLAQLINSISGVLGQVTKNEVLYEVFNLK